MKSRVAAFAFSFLIVVTPLAAAQHAHIEGLEQPFRAGGAYVVRSVDGKVACTDATPDEAAIINSRPRVPLRVFGEERGRVRSNASAGLNIILRGTPQLDANPAAKAAFERAADIWESRIADPITVYVDVDFGTTRFGEAFPDPNILASASSDYRGGDEGLYPQLRPLILARADNATETSVYAALPVSTLPTTLGATTRLAAPSILLRALGALDGAAQEDDSGPSIGFNSAFPYDFDPSNGISPGQQDFEGVVVHEVGHMLGFTSLVGLTELGGGTEIIPAVFDFFRFRPGVSNGSFGTAQRVLSSGGSQVYFAFGTALAFSTGRPDGTGGDENQASHWKDDALTGTRIGIMDPTLSAGERSELTANDLGAFGMMGYNIVAPNTTAPAAPSNLSVTGISATGVRLNWTDNSNNETEFRVEQKVGNAFVDLGSSGANTTQINVTNLAPGTSYTFRIRARNGSTDSPYSNEATGSTFGAGGGSCTPNATTVCLLSDRFRVSIGFINQFANPPAPGNFLGAKLVPGVQNPDVATFGISSAQAIEVVVRIQDARPFGINRFDVYYGGLTDLEYTVSVTDVTTGATKTYRNAPGTVGGGVDRSTFAAALGLGDRLTSGGFDSIYVDELTGIRNAEKGAPLAVRGTAQTQQGVQKAPRVNAGGGGACAESEPNETTTTADALALGEPCTGTATKGDAFQYVVGFENSPDGQIQDVFAFTTTGGAVNFTLNFTNASADLDLFLLGNAGGLQILEDSTGATTTETISFIVAAGTYWLGVSAYEGGSAYTLTGTWPSNTAPAAPTNLTATATSSTVIRLNWTDNSSNETEFRVEQKVGASFQDIGAASANSTQINVTGFSAGSTGTFRIRARGAGGDSAYSNEASATTPGGGPSGCSANATTVCLLSDRFRVSIGFVNQFANPPAPGNFLGAKLQAGAQNPDVATFGISSAQAIEVVVRIQDTRPFGLNRFDVYYGGLTDLEYTVTVTDVTTGLTRTYGNAAGRVGGGVDRTSFTAN